MKHPLTIEELRARTKITGTALRLEERSALQQFRERSAMTLLRPRVERSIAHPG
jgi:hypothetical protein